MALFSLWSATYIPQGLAINNSALQSPKNHILYFKLNFLQVEVGSKKSRQIRTTGEDYSPGVSQVHLLSIVSLGTGLITPLAQTEL